MMVHMLRMASFLTLPVQLWRLLRSQPAEYLLLLAFLGMGYGFYGRHLYLVHLANAGPILLAWAIPAVASVWIVPLGTGGLLGAIAAIALSYFWFGGVAALTCLGAAGSVLWLGLQDTDRPRPEAIERPLGLSEILLAIATAGIVVLLVFALREPLTGPLAGAVAGLVAGTIAAIGPLGKDLGLPPQQRRLIHGSLGAIAIAIGVLYALATYRIFHPS